MMHNIILFIAGIILAIVSLFMLRWLPFLTGILVAIGQLNFHKSEEFEIKWVDNNET